MSTDISIVVCTYNRAHNLADCIKHIADQKNISDITYELIIVDNNSTDNTKEVINKLINKYSGICKVRYVFESQQGLSYARNKGISESKGMYVIFTDDDIEVSENWLYAIYNSFTKHNADVVGGRIWLEDDVLLPKWINKDMYGFLGYRDFGDKDFLMDGKTQFPFGGNMAIKRTLFDEVGFFDVRMGRKGEGKKASELFKGEETDLFHRINVLGGTMYYAADAIVTHKILGHQLKKPFFRTLHYNAGKLKAKLDTNSYPKNIFGIPLFVFRQTINSIIKYVLEIFSRGISSAFRQQMNVLYFFGMTSGYFHKNESIDE